MRRRFHKANRSQLHLLPISIDQWAEDNHLARFAVVNHECKANTTDPASRIMKTHQGHVQGYNAQAIVTADQCIVSAEISREENTPKQRMTRKLRTKAGQAMYKLRSQTVEPVFGQIMGCRGFLRHGLEAVQSEWSLICACFNLRKLYMAAYGER